MNNKERLIKDILLFIEEVETTKETLEHQVNNINHSLLTYKDLDSDTQNEAVKACIEAIQKIADCESYLTRARLQLMRLMSL